MDILFHRTDSNYSSILQIVKALHEKAGRIFTYFFTRKAIHLATTLDNDFNYPVKPSNDPSQYDLSYAEFVVPIFKTVQDQSKKMNAQEELIQNYLLEIKQLKGTLENE